MIGVMLFINWRFAVIAVGIMPVLLLLLKLSTSKLKKGWKKVKEDESLAISVVHEVLGSLRVVKAFGQEENEGRRFVSRSDKAVRGQLRMAWIGASFNFVLGMLFATGTALFIYVGGSYVHEGSMTLGELTMVLAYLAQVYGPLNSISKNINSIQSSLTSIERVFTLLDQEREVKEDAHAIHLSRAKGAFEFAGVGFSYRQGKHTLKDVAFRVNEGDRVGVMGSTGAGKSTLVSLIMRFYDASEGCILIDGVDIRKYKLADYRRQFSMVLQEPVLFSTTIAENIRYGKPDATEAEIIGAAKAANAHDFIMRCAEGYDTPVGERGMQLSGGERQRISIARAFIKNAPVLILDEPTSSLDVRTEAQIMEAMERLMEGRTTFMITHRLDTLAACNVIVHLEHGRLADLIYDNSPDIMREKKLSVLGKDSAHI
jgi:ATP-binding cassette subfamily B protein